jgi:acetyl-CoA carboxylase biotin carboxyl carrier protein
LDLKDIKELIALMRKNDLNEFRLEQEGFKITLKRGVDFPALPAGAVPQLSYAPPATPAHAAPGAAQAAAAEAKEKLREITSPMVGTFYSAASPESAPFATPGKEITDGSVVCIIEAMKVMNEIKAEMDGTIVEVVAENGKPVQFGQVLFRVR